MSNITFGFTAQQIVDEGRVKWEDINLLKTWLETQNLPKLTNEQIVSFLLSCSNEQEPTKETIKTYYSVKKRCPEMFDNRDIKREDLQKQLNTVELSVLPKKTDDGCAVCLVRLHDTYYMNIEQAPAMKLLYMTVDAALYGHPPNGLIYVIDLQGTGVMHLTRVRLGVFKAFIDYLQGGLPVKVINIHCLNSGIFIEKLMYLIKPFVKKEIYDMIIFHKAGMDMEVFYEKWLPKKCLPEEYGGDLPPARKLHHQNTVKLAELESYFKEEELQRHSIN